MQNNTFLTLFVGQSLVKLSEIDSTNNYLKKQLSNTKPLAEGTVIMADHQFAGRGQQGNSWAAAKGKNLTISILLYPTFIAAKQQFCLNKAISLGINDCLTAIIGDDCKIKWPNDIFYEDKKLGGVLVENIAAGSHLKASVVGIGINVNQLDFDDALQNSAVSLVKILQHDYPLNNLLKQLCKSIEKRYLQIKEQGIGCLDDDYLCRLYRFGRWHKYQIADKIIDGCIKGVSPQGHLLLQTHDELLRLDLKQVRFIFNSD